MSQNMGAARARLPLGILGTIFGILLFVHLIQRAGPAKLLASMAALGWGLALVIAWGGVAHILKTWAWRLTLLDGKYLRSRTCTSNLRKSKAQITGARHSDDYGCSGQGNDSRPGWTFGRSCAMAP